MCKVEWCFEFNILNYKFYLLNIQLFVINFQPHPNASEFVARTNQSLHANLTLAESILKLTMDCWVFYSDCFGLPSLSNISSAPYWFSFDFDICYDWFTCFKLNDDVSIDYLLTLWFVSCNFIMFTDAYSYTGDITASLKFLGLTDFLSTTLKMWLAWYSLRDEFYLLIPDKLLCCKDLRSIMF